MEPKPHSDPAQPAPGVRAMDYRLIESLKPANRNPRTHSRKQVRQIADSIQRFGFTNPILIDGDGRIIAGHGRVAAAKLLGLDRVPVVPLGDLSAKDRRAYALADNKLALNAGWDQELLALEFQELIDAGIELEVTGFSLAEVDFTLDQAREQRPGPDDTAPNQIPAMATTAVSRPGDLWRLGSHLLLCGDARTEADYDRLLQGQEAGLVFTDPPYNVPIDGHVCGLGRIRHREFAMGVGEMAADEFSAFLGLTLGHMAGHCRHGAILFVCMDWRHLEELSAAGRQSGLELKNVCVWNKSNGGMGSFYRSKHELVFVYKHGAAPHVNSFGLGDTGRYRTNVWDYPGISSIGASRASEAQDFGEEFWMPIELMLSDHADGLLYVFLDENQDIYGRSAAIPIAGEPMLLDRNCRNTTAIHTAAYRYYRGARIEAPRIAGANVELLTAPDIARQARAIAALVTRMVAEEGVAPHDIGILLCDGRARSLFERALAATTIPKAARWGHIEGYGPGSITVDTVAKFKGLERPIIVLWALDECDPVADRETLYVGMSRAKSLLFLCGTVGACGRALSTAET